MSNATTNAVVVLGSGVVLGGTALGALMIVPPETLSPVQILQWASGVWLGLVVLYGLFVA